MAFGQSSGPPATGQQLRELLELLAAAGHTDFRDARGPMGFTQRQAAGKFTRDEADHFIERLESELYGEAPPAGKEAAIALDEIPAEVLAAELQRRGWVVLQPD
jgi:hypothetical protein